LSLFFYKPPSGLFDDQDAYPVIFSTFITSQPAPPGYINLQPVYQYSPTSSPYYNVRVMD
jgi:hypothetical protein